MRFTRLLALSILGTLAVCARAGAAPIDIPANTWVAVPAAPYGQAACPQGECKHVRVAFNSLDGRTYWLGGDYQSHPQYAQSGSNQMWSYSIADNNWRLETPYCVTSGLVQPSRPDEVGFAIDTRRNQIWMYPGFQYSPGNCTGTEIFGKPVVWNGTSRLWSDPNLPWDATNVRFSQYDPVGDRTLSFEYDGSRVVEHNLATGVVRRINTIIPPGEDGGAAFVAPAYTTLDLQGRKIYVLATVRGKLYRYDLATNEFKFMTTLPVTGADEQMLFWDPVSQVLLWPYRRPRGTDDIAGQVQLFVWHPTTNAWTEIPITPPVDMQGNPVLTTSGAPVQVKGRVGVFDPDQQVMLITGFDSVDPVPYIFLYRYREGPTDLVPPSTPANLRPR
jgi:hypothetical protein